MRILLTGSEGFIGQHLMRELLNVGHIVTGMDIKNGPEYNAADPRSLERIFQTALPDTVVHLASSVVAGDDVMQTVRDNAGTTAVVAQMAAQCNARMVYGSTDQIYGVNGDTWCSELGGPFSPPRSLCALTKLWGEEVCKLYAPERFTALRFSMIYGGPSAISDLLEQVRRRSPMIVHRGAVRSWCWIGDAARGARLAIENGSGPYNIGRSDADVTMEHVAQIACSLTGVDEKLITFVDMPGDKSRTKRISMARLLGLGWEPEVDLEEGMGRLVKSALVGAS